MAASRRRQDRLGDEAPSTSSSLTLLGAGSKLALYLAFGVAQPGQNGLSKEAPVPEVEESVVVARPQREVFDLLAKFESLALYDPFVMASAQVGDGPVGLGTRGRGTSRYMGKSSDWVMEYVEYEPPRRMVARSVEGNRDVTVTFECEPLDGGTRVTERIEVRSGLGLLDKVPARFVNLILGRSLRRNLKNLAAWLESHPTT
ncbi:SRPBCC family protein [Paenarthrobacter sp. NPDC089322]|uniref:SRPBCC family protein n=1 Tax=Paenarthrobacter sp. NPDC089322 TaxID=3155065 RepID=UPI003412F765